LKKGLGQLGGNIFMLIDVALTPLEMEKKEITDKAVVVIDVLRATSTMIVALENGCKGFIPVSTVEEAKKLVAEQKNPNFLLGGERGARRLEGFHLGNSPRDYLPEKVKDKIVVMTTTNGTKALVAAQKAAKVFIGAFLNMSAVSAAVQETRRNVLIACAGEKGLFCLEDTLCAGALVKKLMETATEVSLTDAAIMAKILYTHFEDDLYGILSSCEWGRYLIGLGLEEDVRICAQVDVSQVTPIFYGGKVSLAP